MFSCCKGSVGNVPLLHENEYYTCNSGKREARILLAGPEGSGKSTFIKQLRLIYASGFSTAEKSMFLA